MIGVIPTTKMPNTVCPLLGVGSFSRWKWKAGWRQGWGVEMDSESRGGGRRALPGCQAHSPGCSLLLRGLGSPGYAPRRRASPTPLGAPSLSTWKAPGLDGIYLGSGCSGPRGNSSARFPEGMSCQDRMSQPCRTQRERTAGVLGRSGHRGRESQ